jgi:hypothetical protein
MRMMRRTKVFPLLEGARGRKHGDIEALAMLLANLSRFAVSNFGWFRALDLNPIIVKSAGEGALVVDIAVEPIKQFSSVNAASPLGSPRELARRKEER